jgi:4-hydroxythreonine-4-phosphate dehydrogenase
MGDAGGIGPELITKLLASRIDGDYAPVVIGDPAVLQRAAALLTDADVSFVAGDPDSLRPGPIAAGDAIPVVAPSPLDVDGVQWGQAEVRAGAAAGACLTYAFELAQRGLVDGVVSAPMNKQTFHEAGYTQIDELAYLAEVTHSSEPLLVGVVDGVWTAAVTLHTPLRAVADLITRERVFRHIRALHEAILRATGEQPVLAVAGLNPHAGDGGLLGREEIDEIGPAIDDARTAGIDAAGPFAADTIFLRAFAGDYQGVVCMYHDQANIARKLRGLASGATLFLGLPVVVGTTAHGTAYDIAGLGIADPGSLQRALVLVVSLSRQSA